MQEKEAQENKPNKSERDTPTALGSSFKNIKPEYQKMMNNLLGLTGGDGAILAKKDAKNLGINEKAAMTAFQRDEIGIEIIEQSEQSAQIMAASTPEDLLEIAQLNGLRLSKKDKTQLQADFENAKITMAQRLGEDEEKKVAVWKIFQNRYTDYQIQKNSWPLFIGTMFIKVKMDLVTVHAPLLLKRAVVEINGNRVFVKTTDRMVEINEKLAYLLKRQYGIDLPKPDYAKAASFAEAAAHYSSLLSHIMKKDYEFSPNFFHLKKTEITNTSPEYAPGMALLIMSPAGGKLRDKFVELVETGEIEDVLDVEVLSGIKENVDEKLAKGTENIVRITHTDISQEKAILAALMDTVIIWGPPGTGKSQTICNVLANLMLKRSSVLITSEKKAALDVIQQRMGKLSKYVFFALADKNVEKAVFYKNLQELKDRIEGFNDAKNTAGWSSTISREERNFYALDDILGKADLDVYAQLSSQLLQDPATASFLKQNTLLLRSNKELIESSVQLQSVQLALEKHNIKKQGFWLWKKYEKNIAKLLDLEKISKNQFDKASGIILQHEQETVDGSIKVPDYLAVEEKYRNHKKIFKNDMDYLDDQMFSVFKSRLQELLFNPETKKAAKSFWTSIDSGFYRPVSFLRKHAPIIRQLFTVFVSTPQTLADFIDTDRKYDVAIFDEASQMHIEKAIPFLAMCKKAIIAGDNQQMQPTLYFQMRDDSEIVEETEETAVSLLDYAERKGVKSFMLSKNYRAKSAELMAFSSKHFYEAKLSTIDAKDSISKEAIEVFNVNGQWIDQRNEKEARHVLEEVLQQCKTYEEILILALNAKQRDYIEELIFSDPDFSALEDLIREDKLKLRSLENVQGDEADLVVVTVAYSPGARIPSTYVGKPEGRFALNVAISRARQKIIIFKSISAPDVKVIAGSNSVMTFRKWLEYLDLDKNERKQYLLHSESGEDAASSLESGFEEEVWEFLKTELKSFQKIQIRSQFPIGSYRLDFAILEKPSSSFLLGLEVDGYKYHSGIAKRIEDSERQDFIEAKGYELKRITELAWKTNRQAVLAEISGRLKELVKK